MGRDTYEMRAATAIPSATGGRPSTSAPLAAATGNDIAPVETITAPVAPLGDISSLIQNGKIRYVRQPRSFLPQVQVPNRTLEQYSVNNADMVNLTESYIDKVAQRNPKILEGFESAHEAALWAVAHIQRSFEPGSAPRMVDMVHQSRAGRQVYRYLRQIEEAQNVES
jgi:hypothetical protein